MIMKGEKKKKHMNDFSTMVGTVVCKDMVDERVDPVADELDKIGERVGLEVGKKMVGDAVATSAIPSEPSAPITASNAAMVSGVSVPINAVTSADPSPSNASESSATINLTA